MQPCVRFSSLSGVAILLVLGALASDAQAQANAVGWGPGRSNSGRRPSVSPYLAIAAGAGGGVGVNGQTGQVTSGFSAIAAANAYANITRPGLEQQRLQAQQAGLGRQVNRIQSQVRGTKLSAADLASGMLISQTGKAATYSNYSHYYPNKQRR